MPISLIVVLFCLLATAQESVSKPPSRSNTIIIPPAVAKAVRLILDEKQKDDNERRLSNLLYNLTQRKDHTSDEALVVLMCFNVGESQEEEDAVIARGGKMLPLLRKYGSKNPTIPGHDYARLLKGASSKRDAFEGAVTAIHRGWHSTADNPEG